MKKTKTTEIMPVYTYRSEAFPDFEYEFILPPGVKLNDIFMTAREVAKELGVCVKVVHNMRKAGKLSSTTMTRQPMYFRQEIAGMLKANIVVGKNSYYARLGLSSWLAAFMALLSCLDYIQPVADLV
jgi:hypothetical protein